MPGLSQAFHAVIRQARALATSRNHDHFILEDIALALTDHDGVKKLVESRGGDVEQLRNDLKARAPVLPPYQANVLLVGGLPMLYPTGRGVLMYHLLNKMQPQPAPSAGRVLQRARSRAESRSVPTRVCTISLSRCCTRGTAVPFAPWPTKGSRSRRSRTPPPMAWSRRTRAT